MSSPVTIRSACGAIATLTAAVLIAGCSSAVGTPTNGLSSASRSGSPTPVASSSSLTQPPVPSIPFISKVHAYRVSHPRTWTVNAGHLTWTATRDDGTDGVADMFRIPGSAATISVASQVIPPGVTATQWLADYLPPPGGGRMPACFPSPAKAQTITVDSRPAYLFGGFAGCSFTRVIVIASGRAYVVTAAPAGSSFTMGVFDWPTMDAFLATMRLATSTNAA